MRQPARRDGGEVGTDNAEDGLVAVAQTLDLTGFTLPPSQELADLFGPKEEA